MSETQYEGIAIIGMTGRFPGADSVEEFWSNLVAGKESISFFTDAELAEGPDIEELRRHGHYVAARGVLKDADCFDAAFFGVHPKEAEVMDPQQRVFLEACWEGLERAGYPPSQMRCTVGVFGGITFNTYYLHEIHPRPDLIELIGPELVMFGNEKDYLTTRVAYKLGLKGPALNVSTACSTSLVAVCEACQSLLTYQCDIALAGGASIRVPQKRGYYYDEGNIGSSDGHTRTFDAQATGTVFSNGVAVVVLKRLADAVKDGDQVYAVIKGAAINNDGSQRVSFGAPGVEGQSEVIAMAHALAGMNPETITYVEAHGTATPLGDPIEVAGLTKAFRLSTAARQFCALGSVKTNIGHLDAAAGVTGLIKTALALHNKTIPATLHFTKPNPKLSLDSSPFYVNAELTEWRTKPGVPRRAGVSSFGTGGTNAHVVLEEAPDIPPSGLSRPWQLLMLSAKTPDALERATVNLSNYLKEVPDQTDDESRRLADTAFTLQAGRSEFIHRRIVVCQNAAEGAAAFEALDPKRVFSHQQQFQDPPIVFMFPGQGSQYPGMGAELYRSEPIFRAEVDGCAELLRAVLHEDLRALLFSTNGSRNEAERLLVQTRFTQPALFVIEYALAKLWMSWGIKPAAMIGHSVGEYVAGCLAGVFTLEDALSLVTRRGALVQEQPSGSMLSIRLSEKELLPLLSPQLAIAAINSPNLCVVSGPHDAVATLEKQLESQNVAARHLHTSHAFHSPMMEPVLEPFTQLLRLVKLNAPQIPYVSNVTGRWISPEEATSAEYWAGHVRQPVRFADGIAELLKNPRNILLEVGPGQVLSTIARQHPARSAGQTVLASLPLAGTQESRGFLETLGRLWMAGLALDWNSFYAHECRHRVVLPTYPFERKRYWPESVPMVAQPPTSAASTASVGVATDGHTTAGIQVSASQSQDHLDLPRKERLLMAARSLLQELSGYDLSEVEPSVNFMELGFDSLLLTQAAQLFQRKFGVSFTFRQLMEELSSLNDIASHLDAVLSPEKFPAVSPPATPPVQATVPGIGQSTNSALEQLLLQQQRLTNQLLQLLGRQPNDAPPSLTTVSRTVPPPLASEAKPHGPFKPIDRTAGVPLSSKQSTALNALIVRYTQRTAGSKQLAIQNRPILADPRSVAGFNKLWKEMVYPIVTARSDGSKVWDVDGNEYVDFVMGFGASMFGHRPPFVVQALRTQLEQGFEIGPIQALAGEVAALIRELTGMQRVGFTNTGSEAVLAATRVARTITGRDKIAVFAGAYHGIFDEVLFRPPAVEGEADAGPIAPGIPATALSQVIVLDYGNPQSLEVLRARGSEIAAVLVEPVQSRRLELQPREFLHELRRITEETGSALIFDEMVTGFRVHPGGAQAYFGVRADLATYGKVLGGGLPIGVVTGIPRFMDALDGGQWEYGDKSFPEIGVTFFAGTFVRHPLALAAAKAVLTHLKQNGPELQQELNKRTEQVAIQLRAVIDEFHAPYHLTQFSSLIQLKHPSHQKLAGLLFYLLRERGIHIWENRAFILTTAHNNEDITRLVGAFRESLSAMQVGGFLPSSAVLSDTSSILKDSLPADQAHDERVSVDVSESVDHSAFPLTEAQKEIWLAAQMGGDAAVAYNESLSLHFYGAFDVDAFRAAICQVVERHPILLASLNADGQWQQVKADATVSAPLLDLSSQSTTRREYELAMTIEREVSEPFDLVAGPLLRLRVVRLSDDHHVVIWTAHHIVCDGWSSGLLMNELATIYSALKRGIEPILSRPASFRDYALAAQADSPDVQDAINYWCQNLADLPPPLDLPVNRRRPLVRSARASTLRHNFDGLTHQELKRAARQQRTTMVVLLMAGMNFLLNRLTGQTDLIIGLPVAGQAVTGHACLVGHCVNLLPIRIQFRPEASIQENVAAVKKGVLDAYDHHQCTIGSILQHLRTARSPNRSPLVEVIFNVDRDLGAVEFQGVQFTCDRNPKRALHFDLFLNCVEGPEGLYVDCDYNTDLFDSLTIERWMQHYEILLQGIAARPTEILSTLPILTKDQRNELIVKRNKTALDFPKQQALHSLFECQAEKTPDAVAVTFESSHLTYGELNRRANQVAHYLKGLGVGPEVLVGLFLDRSPVMVIGILGILKAGGAYVPMDPTYPQQRISYILEDSKTSLVLTQGSLADKLPGFDGQSICLDTDWIRISAESQENPIVPTRPGQLVYVLFTSGSTGRPKGVALEHRASANFIQWANQVFTPQELSGVLFSTSVCFDLSVFEIFVTLSAGGQIIIAPNILHLPTLQGKDDVTLINTVPSAMAELVRMRGIPNSVRTVNLAGEALPEDLVEQIYSTTKVNKVYNLYGPTEATTYSTYTLVPQGSPVTIGKPIANTQTYILDPHRNPVPLGVNGELYLAGTGLARGYYGRPELTDERFVANPFSAEIGTRMYRTGDMCRWLSDGDIQYLGRMDHQIKLRGFRIELGEIEAVLKQHTSVRQSVVILREDEPGLQQLVAYVVTETKSEQQTEDLRQHLRRSLPDFMVPSSLVLLDAFPLTANGKIDRNGLPPPSDHRIGVQGEFAGPHDPLKEALVQIWSKILKVRRVGLRDNFFELGGHSLAAVRLLSEIQKLTGKILPLATLFQASTVEALAEVLRNEGWSPSWSSLVPIQPVGPKHPLFLVHGAEGNVLLYYELTRYLGPDQPVYGLQSQGLNGEGSLDATIEIMASRYVKEIMTAQPSGPYFLGGYCLGGTIAFEMAQQLRAMGEQVECVILLDTYNSNAASSSQLFLQRPLHFLQNLYFHGANAASIPARDRNQFLRAKIDIELSRLAIRIRALYDPVQRLFTQKTHHRYPHLAVKKTNDQAALSYVPRPYDGHVVLIRPKTNFWGLADSALGWDRVVRDLEIRELPIYPKGMLIEPFCRSLAETLGLCLENE